MSTADEIVSYVIEQVALDGIEGSAIERLWEFAREKVDPLDDALKSTIWRWLQSRADELSVGVKSEDEDGETTYLDPASEDLSELPTLLEKYGTRLCVRVSEDLLWRTLTGASKEDGIIGLHPFILLCAITRKREAGLTNIEAAKITKQDPRSLFSRIASLVNLGLVKKIPMVLSSKAGGRTAMLINTRFYREGTEVQDFGGLPDLRKAIDTAEVKREIMEKLKAAKNGIRQRTDLRIELKLSSGAPTRRLFDGCILVLENHGYIRRVTVVRAFGDSNRKYFCIQLIKDYDAEIKEEPVDTSTIDRNDDDMDDVSDSEAQENSVVERFEVSEGDNIEEAQGNATDYPTFGRHFPLENQIYDAAVESGSAGKPIMEITREITGDHFRRPLTAVLDRCSTQAGDQVSKSGQPRGIGHYGLVRATDNSARISFFRYFTMASYYKFVGQNPDLLWGQFPAIETSSVYRSREQLLKLSYSAKRYQRPIFVENGAIAADRSAKKKRQEGDTIKSERKLGRPRKLPVTDGAPSSVAQNHTVDSTQEHAGAVEASSSSAQSNPLAEQPVKRKRGRPRKDSQLTPSLPSTPVVSREAVTVETPTAEGASTGVTIPENAGKNVDQSPSVTAPAAEATPAAVANTPRPADKDAKKLRRKPVEDSPSIAVVKTSIGAAARQNYIMQLINENGGAIIGGNALTRKLRDSRDDFSQGTLDRKTVTRDENALVEKQLIRRFLVSVVDSRGMNDNITILALPHLDLDSPEVQKMKEQATERIESRFKYKPGDRTVISDDFSFYQVTPVNALKAQNAVQRRAEKALATAKLNAAQKKAASERLKKRMRQRQAEGGIGTGSLAVGEDGEPSTVMPRARRGRPKRPIAVPILPGDSTDAILPKSAPRKVQQPRVLSDLAAHPLAIAAKPSESGGTPKSRQKRQLGDELAEHALKRAGKRVRRSGSGDEAKRITRNSRLANRLNETQLDEIFRTIIVIRSLYGGSMRSIHWDKVTHALREEYSVEICAAVWSKRRKEFGSAARVNKIADRWERVFCDAYEADKFPGLDFENVDVPMLVKYWRENDIEVVDDDESVSAFTDLKKTNVGQEFVFVREEERHSWLDDMYTFVSSVRTEDALVNAAFSCPCDDGDDGAGESISESSELASPLADDVRHLIKSIISTDEAKYNPAVGKAMLESYGAELCAKVVGEMEKERSITYAARELDRRLPGRNFMFAERFQSMARLRPDENLLAKACAFHRQIESVFAESKGMMMSRLAPNGSMVCILELISREQVELVRVNVNAGTLIEGYTSRNIDREKLDCDIVLRSSSAAAVSELPRVAAAIPVPVDSEGKVRPGSRTWVDVNGEIKGDVFLRFVNVILMAIALHPGVPERELRRRYHCILTGAEVLDIVRWVVEKKLVEHDAARGDGYWVSEGWYHSGADGGEDVVV
ncbi:hypothetical protein BZA70DRAFT_28173 [Myxozyma melibiosi]|uniref:Uncharacterized protein n=1 Tax=Myxozyma melibiosi TaxID=54550 RepID=A0ABR1FDD3_9ASCO